MSLEYDRMKSNVFSNARQSLTVQDQHELAEILAANCGYKLVQEDTERSLEIKELKEKIYKGYGGIPVIERRMIIEGLEALLK